MNKYSELKSELRNPTSFGDLVAFVAAIFAFIFTCLDMFNQLGEGWIAENLDKFTLLLVSLLVISNVIERRFLIRRLQTKILDEVNRIKIGPYFGLENVYANRLQLPPYAKNLEKGYQEIYIAGIEFGYITLNQLPTLEQKANQGCKIRLLMVNPGIDDQANPLIELLEATFDFHQLGSLLETNIGRISDWIAKLPDSIKGRVELRVSDSIPTHIVTLIDKNLPTGKMVLEMLPPKVDPRDRWLVTINAHNGGDLYTRYVEAYEKLWEEALPWTRTG